MRELRKSDFSICLVLLATVGSRPLLAILLAGRPEDLAVDRRENIAVCDHFTVVIFLAGARCERDDDIAS